MKHLILAALVLGTSATSWANQPPLIAPPPPPATKNIVGTVIFDQDTKLPTGSVVTVQLIDGSVMDRAAPVLGQQVIRNAKQLPTPFRIPYNSAKIQAHLKPFYSVSVRIENQNKLLYINDTRIPAFDVPPVIVPVIKVD